MSEKKSNKITKRVAKKTTEKKVASKKVAKKPLKKTVRVSKKKAPTKKTVRKKTISQTKKESRVKKSTKATKVTKNKAPESVNVSQDVVKLPSNASIRSIAKAQAITDNLDEYIEYCVRKIALTAAACFLLVGTSLAMSEALDGSVGQLITSVPEVNAAQLINAQVRKNISDQIYSPQNSTGFDLLTEIPSEVSEDTKLTFIANKESHVTATVHSVDSTLMRDLIMDSILDGKYRTEIRVADFESGYYEIEFKIENSEKSEPEIQYTKEFYISSLSEEAEVSDPLSTAVNGVGTSSAEMSDINESEIASVQNKSFALSIVKQSEKIVHVQVQAVNEVQQLEVYMRPLGSLRETFLTTLRKRERHWFGVLDTTHIPSGSYELYARGFSSSGEYLSSGAQLSINHYAEMQEQSENQIGQQNIGDDLEMEQVTVEREFTPIQFSTGFSTSSPYQRSALSILKNNQSEIEEMLKLYAVAVQVNSLPLVSQVTLNIDQFINGLVERALLDGTSTLLANDLENLLLDSINTLQVKIRTFENLRKERTQEASAIDTDKDGVADFDEINFFGTDPVQYDTDQDGYADGFEVISGFNPRSVTNNSIVAEEVFGLESAIVQSDLLAINTVTPVIPVHKDFTEYPVKIKFEGRGLPNTFVTLLLLSDSSVFTAKTDKDGVFTYLLDKHISDGLHEARVVLTDNTGKVLVASESVKFTKEKNQLLLKDERKKVVPLSASVVVSNDYNVGSILGLSIISLGLILFMLSTALRRKKDLEVKDRVVPTTS